MTPVRFVDGEGWTYLRENWLGIGPF